MRNFFVSTSQDLTFRDNVSKESNRKEAGLKCAPKKTSTSRSTHIPQSKNQLSQKHPQPEETLNRKKDKMKLQHQSERKARGRQLIQARARR